MDFYSEALTFFMENGIQLNNEQLSALQEKSAYTRYMEKKVNDMKKHKAKADVYESLGPHMKDKAKAERNKSVEIKNMKPGEAITVGGYEDMMARKANKVDINGLHLEKRNFGHHKYYGPKHHEKPGEILDAQEKLKALDKD